LPKPLPGPKLEKALHLELDANDIVYDPTRGHLYASVGSAAANHANSVVAVDVATGQLVWSLNVGSDPGSLALSGNGKALWIGLGGAKAILGIDVARGQAGPLIPRDDGFAERVVVMPGTTDVVAVSLAYRGLSPRHAGVAAFQNGEMLPKKSQGHTGSNRL